MGLAQSWQGINSAPKDGRNVLLACILDDGRSFIAVGHWRQQFKDWWDIGFGVFSLPAKYWMPLPPLPATEIEGGQP